MPVGRRVRQVSQSVRVSFRGTRVWPAACPAKTDPRASYRRPIKRPLSNSCQLYGERSRHTLGC